jgi:TonB family protein
MIAPRNPRPGSAGTAPWSAVRGRAIAPAVVATGLLTFIAAPVALGTPTAGEVLEPFIEAVMEHVGLRVESCPPEVRDAHAGRVTICAPYRSHFSAFKLDWEASTGRYDLSEMARPLQPWTYKRGRYVRVFEVEEKELTVSFDDRGGRVVLSYEGESESPGGAEPGPARKEPPRVAGFGGVSLPEVVEASRVDPDYPSAAKERGIEGSVILEVVVLRDGTVGEVSVLRRRPEGWGFEQAATGAVKQWRFEPARHEGVAVDAVFTTTIEFDLDPE